MAKDTAVLSDVSIISLSAVAVYTVLSVVVGFKLGKTKTQKWIITWLIFDAITHFVLVRTKEVYQFMASKIRWGKPVNLRIIRKLAD